MWKIVAMLSTASIRDLGGDLMNLAGQSSASYDRRHNSPWSWCTLPLLNCQESYDRISAEWTADLGDCEIAVGSKQNMSRSLFPFGVGSRVSRRVFTGWAGSRPRAEKISCGAPYPCQDPDVSNKVSKLRPDRLIPSRPSFPTFSLSLNSQLHADFLNVDWW